VRFQIFSLKCSREKVTSVSDETTSSIFSTGVPEGEGSSVINETSTSLKSNFYVAIYSTFPLDALDDECCMQPLERRKKCLAVRKISLSARYLNGNDKSAKSEESSVKAMFFQKSAALGNQYLYFDFSAAEFYQPTFHNLQGL
jgi:hypothetical protein